MALFIPTERQWDANWAVMKRRVRQMMEDRMERMIDEVLECIDDEMENIELERQLADSPAKDLFADPEEDIIIEDPDWDDGDGNDDPYAPSDSWHDVWEKAAQADPEDDRPISEFDEPEDDSNAWSGWDADSEDETEW